MRKFVSYDYGGSACVVLWHVTRSHLRGFKPCGRLLRGRITYADNHSRPRAKGGKLTEENLKFWLSIVRCMFFARTFSHAYRIPRSRRPANRPSIKYVKSQRSLLEADALARAPALRESRMLDEKMRDAPPICLRAWQQFATYG